MTAVTGLPGAAVMQARMRLAWLGLSLLAVLLLFWPTFVSIVAIWMRSETFAHGFLVPPVVGYLVWRKRVALGQIGFQTDPVAVLGLGVFGVTWLAGRVTDVLVVEQFSVIGLIVSLVWLILGRRALRILGFPLGFLFFAVPVGEGLVDPLMDFTAVFTVALLRLSGIPVFSDGTFFSIPSGDWSVVEACSGLRYLIASVFLGVLYAYLSYRSIWRRLAFVALATIVPIVANGLRAYLIVMLGHLSDMKLAVGIDHLIYGWVFFGLVMFVLFAIGNLWSERGLSSETQSTAAATRAPARESLPRFYAGLALGLSVVLVWPALASYVDRGQGGGRLDVSGFELPPGRNGWLVETKSLTKWTPHYIAPSMELRQEYRRGPEHVGVHIAFYGDGEGELVNSQNVMVPQKDPLWRMPHQTDRRERFGGTERSIIEAELQSDRQELLTWHWYWIDGTHVANDYLAKLHEAKAAFLGDRFRQAGIVLYTPIELKPQTARQRLQRFVEDMMPAIETSLAAVTWAKPDQIAALDAESRDQP